MDEGSLGLKDPLPEVKATILLSSSSARAGRTPLSLNHDRLRK